VTQVPHATTGKISIENEVQRIRALLKDHRFAEAVNDATALRTAYPENRDLLYLLALGLRHMRRIPAALEVLGELERHHPRMSALFQERGHCYVALKDAVSAIQAYEQAVRINPALPDAWSMLERLQLMVGNADQSRIAAEHVRKLRSVPPEVIRATGLFCEGDLALAERIVRGYLLQHSNQVEAMRLLARIGIAQDILDDAEILLAAALEMAPDYTELRRDYACVLLDRHKHAEAIAQLDLLLATDSGNTEYRTLRATATVGLGNFEDGIRGFSEVLAQAGQTPRSLADLHLSIGHAQKTLGHRAEAIDSYRKAIAARPNFGDAYWSLANLKTYRFSDADLTLMRQAEAASDTQSIDRYHLCFALGKAYEDRGDFSAAWHYYERGNAQKRAESRYRPELLEQNTALQKQFLTTEFVKLREGYGASSHEPIFILGMPRAGSTLLEQILASHSQVEGTQELANVPRAVLDLQGYNPDLDNPRYPGCLVDISTDELRTLGEKYLCDTQVYRNGRPRFIDKMPNNWRHIGLIHLMLPNSVIIDARREPMACCFGNLKQLYARGQEFAYSIEDMARYYRTYLELMAHWNAVLPPGRILRVLHEDVVEDLEGSVRRLLGHCGLEFEPACIEFHKTRRSIRTASSEQVRQPIYREGLEQWRNFEPWLGALKEALGDALVRYRDS